MTTKEKPAEKPRPPLQEEDIAGCNWASLMSGLSPAQIVAKAKAGEIPDAWKLGPGGWRFYKPSFLKWLQSQISHF